VITEATLKLARVPEPVIIADYAVSEQNMSCVFERQHKQLVESGLKFPEFIFGSQAEDMEETLHYFNQNYGNAADYLLRCGLTQHEVYSLTNRFVMDAHA
jgi:protein-tyrosine phosphatase